MKLYHGTTEVSLEKLLVNGISPRGDKSTNWKDYPSRVDMVYLTQSYALYFAIQATQNTDKERILIIEVDSNKLNQTKFFPDEDFLAQEINDLSKHDEFRDNLVQYKNRWKDSLSKIGNVAYKGIVHPYSFSRYCLIDVKKHAEVAMMGLDPTISIMNYKFVGFKYRNLIAWLFGDSDSLVTPEEVEMYKQLPNMEQWLENWDRLSKDRSGIEIVNMAK